MKNKNRMTCKTESDYDYNCLWVCKAYSFNKRKIWREINKKGKNELRPELNRVVKKIKHEIIFLNIYL